MKLFNILSHPYTLIISFLMILISGEHLGGFYILYIMLALPYAGIHSILAVFGIVVLLTNYHLHSTRKPAGKPFLNLSGLACMLASITLFFLNDRQHYNWGTFEQAIPISTFVVFFVIACCFIIRNINTTGFPGKVNHRIGTNA